MSWYSHLLSIKRTLANLEAPIGPLDKLIIDQTNLAIQLYQDCQHLDLLSNDELDLQIYVGIKELEKLWIKEFGKLPDDSVSSVFLTAWFTKEVLEITKAVGEKSLQRHINGLEKWVYNTDNPKILAIVGREIGRRIINNQWHPVFGVIKKHIGEQLEYLGRIESNKKSNSSTCHSQNPYSVLQWATIFYYADETKLTFEGSVLRDRMRIFIQQHELEHLSFNSFYQKYYQAKKRINENNNYPIDKLEKIINFLEEKYPQTVQLALRDIDFIKEDNADY